MAADRHAVESAREKLETGGKPAFIITDQYGITGMFSFYIPQAQAALKTTPLVYCIDSEQPVNQFYFWPATIIARIAGARTPFSSSELDPYPLESGWLWKWLDRDKRGLRRRPAPAEYSRAHHG